jgi:hypothetical protein
MRKSRTFLVLGNYNMNYFHVCLYWLICIVIFMVIFMNDVLFVDVSSTFASTFADKFGCNLNPFLCNIFKGTCDDIVS